MKLFSWPLKNGVRLVLLLFVATLVTICLLKPFPAKRYRQVDLDATSETTSTHDHVLILTPLKESEGFIDIYFENILRQTYPHDHISFGFLVSDSSDGTLDTLKYTIAKLKNNEDPSTNFHSVQVYEKDFDYEMPADDRRHDFDVQFDRRKVMARSRNTLLSVAMREEFKWVLWLDVDVVIYPDTLIEDLIGLDKDVVATHCMWQSGGESGTYDWNNWQETEKSYAYQNTLKPDDILVEGYWDVMPTERLHLHNFRANSDDRMYAVPLDGVGGACTLVRADVHRSGAIFPAYPFKHQVETEGLAKMAKSQNFGVWGLPNYIVFHYL